jgi:hypothetical protein
MKHIFLFTALLIGVSAFSQEWEGIWEIEEFGDTISFSEPSEIIFIDTSNTNLWEIATPSKVYLDSAYSAPLAMITDSINTYPDSADTYFELLFSNEDPYFYMEQFFIGFIHKYDTDTLRDGGFMTVSFDNGENYVNVIENPNGSTYFYDEFPNENNNSLNLYSESDTLYNGEYGYSGNSNGWLSTMLGWNVIYIAPPKGGGELDSIRFRFNFISDSLDNSREGWMIDDIYTFRVEILSSVKDQYKVQFKLFPNPASNRIMVETEKDYQELKMEIRSITAKEITHFANGAGNRLEADGIDLETGVYLVTVYGDGEFLGTARCVMHR